jgi:hypothetical protein
MELLRSRVRSRAGRRGALVELPCLEAQRGPSLNVPSYAAFPTKAIVFGRSSRATLSSRFAAPAKSPRRRSELPRVVLYAAFVSPKPSLGILHCSCGSSFRGVMPESASSRQKSLRGLAKCAPAAADRKPGLIPQKN